MPGSPEQNMSFADLSSETPRQQPPRPEDQDLIDPELLKGQPIVETETAVSFVGVNLPKGKGGPEVPDRSRFQNIERTLTTEDLRQMQKIAVALKLKQPIMLEEYSGSGKTTKVEHMCSLLNTEAHYANCHDFDADVLIGKMSTDESTKSGFGWQDGLVMHAIRNGGVLFLDEYNFMRGDVRARMHEILDALLRGKESISLIENNHEIVPVNPDLRIVAAQNPPGGEFGDREVLDPAQYTRFVQVKGPSEMPKETKLARALGFVNRDNEITIKPEEYLATEANLTPEQLAEIPGIEEILRKFIEFEDGYEQMVKNRQIATDQPQPIYTAFQRDLDRVWQFSQMFYNGDINDTFQRALRYYYSNRLESEEDRAKVEEQIRHVAYIPTAETRRRTLDDKEKQPESANKARAEKEIADLLANSEIPDSVKEALRGGETILSPDMMEAKAIMGKDFIGPEEAKSAFGVEGSIETPAIPFSKEELERAKELDQMLLLRLPMTMTEINDKLGGKVKDGKKLLYSSDEKTGKLKDDAWYKDEKILKEDRIEAKWALVSKDIVPETSSKNYLGQTDKMVDYLKNQVFKDKTLPESYQAAIDEFQKVRSSIESTLASDWKKAAEMLEGLQITELTRQTPAEALYDLAAYFQTNGERLLPNMYTWTKRRASDGGLLLVGAFGSDGVYVDRNGPGRSFDYLGVSFSRSR